MIFTVDKTDVWAQTLEHAAVWKVGGTPKATIQNVHPAISVPLLTHLEDINGGSKNKLKSTESSFVYSTQVHL